MNERIKVLARQSGELPTQDCGVPQWYIDEDELEKFAELIIKECMSHCDETSAAYLKHQIDSDDFQDKNMYAEGRSASDKIKYKIKKNFGIES